MEVVRETKPEWLATLYPEESKPKMDAALGSVHFSTGEEEGTGKLWESVGYGQTDKDTAST